MSNISHLNLAPTFAQQLIDDGFRYVGYYEIQEGNVCKIHVDKEAGIGNSRSIHTLAMSMAASTSALGKAKVCSEID
jgi:hypothetical protein